jgi:predicted metal-dependent hydrolase
LNSNTSPPILYSLRRSERAKTTRIVVKADKIEVVAPPKVSERQIKAFVAAQQDWIKAAILRVADHAQAIPSLAPDCYTNGVNIPYQGRQIPLQLKTEQRKTTRVQLHDDFGFIVNLPSGISAAQCSESIRLALVRWMKNQAGLQAALLIEKHASRLQLFPRSLKIKTQKSRWGSCGPHNDLNLNWLLLLAPPEVFEYVVIHELCHIKHKNHSQDFWQLVGKHYPDYQQQRQWLKQHGASLMKGL